ncbi:hypothetical protein [Nostoc sp.]
MGSTNIAPETEDGLGTASDRASTYEPTCWLGWGKISPQPNA